jgi:hypothetical protein
MKIKYNLKILAKNNVFILKMINNNKLSEYKIFPDEFLLNYNYLQSIGF